SLLHRHSFPTRRSSDLSTRIPTVESLEQFWFMLQEDMTASGRISRINAPVVDRDGQQQQAPVLLVGPFVAIADDQYLGYRSEVEVLQVLNRQPGSRDLIRDFAAPRSELADLLVDPTRGTVLAQMQQTPTFMDRVHQGGLVGYVILALGA